LEVGQQLFVAFEKRFYGLGMFSADRLKPGDSN
jgi:hypothetical protein